MSESASTFIEIVKSAFEKAGADWMLSKDLADAVRDRAGEIADVHGPIGDTLRIWARIDQPGVQWPQLAALLAEHGPDAYLDITGEEISALLRGLGVPSVDVKFGGEVRKGCRFVGLTAALLRRYGVQQRRLSRTVNGTTATRDGYLLDAVLAARLVPEEREQVDPSDELRIKQALVNAGIVGTRTSVTVEPVIRDGNAWSVEIELPAGTTASRAIRRRSELASAFGIGVSQIAVRQQVDNARRMLLWVVDEQPFAGEPLRSPLLGSVEPVDLWDPVPIGINAQGRPVEISLPFSGVLLGGLPRMGKTVSANNLLAAAALDPRCQLWIADGKGLDARPLLPLAHCAADRDPESLVTLVDLLVEEMERRYRRLAELKLDKLSRDVSYEEMPLILLWIDELRHYTDAPERSVAKKLTQSLIEIASIGPAAGIIPVLATQRPSSKVVSPDLRDLIPVRWALRCTTWHSSDTILGAGAAARGASAAELSPEPKGVGIVVGLEAEAITLRSYRLEITDMAEIAAVAERLRRSYAESVREAVRRVRAEWRPPTS